MKKSLATKLTRRQRIRQALGRILLAVTAFSLSPAILADEPEMVETMVVEEEVEEAPFVSGALNLVVDTHFISYGADVWATGQTWSDLLFHPSLELYLDLGAGFTGIVGTWWDVNDTAQTSIGSGTAIQEVDVWAGISYAVEKWSFTVLYQDWMYASQSEIIVDGIVSYDHWLSPKLVIHCRVDNGFGPAPNGVTPENGVVGVLGIAPGKEFGIVSVSVPVNIAVNTDEYHAGDAGFTFFNLGLAASVPLEFMPGDWSLNGGVTYWHTPSSTVPNNPHTDFLTGSIGMGLSF